MPGQAPLLRPPYVHQHGLENARRATGSSGAPARCGARLGLEFEEGMVLSSAVQTGSAAPCWRLKHADACPFRRDGQGPPVNRPIQVRREGTGEEEERERVEEKRERHYDDIGVGPTSAEGRRPGCGATETLKNVLHEP